MATTSGNESNQTHVHRTAGSPQRLGKRAERKVALRLRAYGLIVQQMPYACPFDLLVEGNRVEVKAAEPQNDRKHRTWDFNIHRHGVVRENVDFYILRLEKVPEFKYAIHLVIKAPIRTSTVSISLRSLITKYAKHFNRFDLIKEASRLNFTEVSQ